MFVPQRVAARRLFEVVAVGETKRPHNELSISKHEHYTQSRANSCPFAAPKSETFAIHQNIHIHAVQAQKAELDMSRRNQLSHAYAMQAEDPA